MSLGTLERSAPPFFKQGPSALSKLALYSALALFLMVADVRFQLTGTVRQAVATILYPVQWLMLQPVEFVAQGSGYFQSLKAAQENADAARKQMTLMSQRSIQAEQLMQENARLRQLLDLRTRLETPAQAAQVLYDTADPYTRRVVVDQGRVAGVELGAPVLDEKGVLGQVTRVHPFVSEVTLLIDRDQAIPVLNIRTGVRGVAYGDPVAGHAGGMELRFMPANADILEGDLLTTSGVDGLYPPGLPVAKVVRVERRADSAFARIYCAPIAGVQGARHVMLLKPAAEPMPARPEPDAALPGKKGARK
ncbi:rod shape-determining protein MreC [Acidovorax carolinensis]|uniref:rod shape-determining protein MreC n=1 Tax=Acidovorax carolinensis TaxID=553814 RepID=UPI000B34913F|nr:rod shape-determining protein MreC [Acidovorax carolinensis]ART46911.1 rod shape-determining protein MreC [Acidovorax carolinensis]